MNKKLYSVGKVTFDFIIGYIIYSIIGGILGTIASSLLERYIELPLLSNIVQAIVTASVAIILSTESTFKRATIAAEGVQPFITNVIIFFIVISALSAMINYYQYSEILYAIINFAFNLAIPLAFIPFVKRKFE